MRIAIIAITRNGAGSARSYGTARQRGVVRLQKFSGRREGAVPSGGAKGWWRNSGPL